MYTLCDTIERSFPDWLPESRGGVVSTRDIPTVEVTVYIPSKLPG